MVLTFQELTEQDTTDFYTKLSNDEILKENKTPYTHESKNSYIRVFKTYMRWICDIKYKNIESLNYEVLAKWMKDFDEEVKIAALTKDEVLRLAEVNNLKNKSLILTLFDTGARVQEFLNIRVSDVELIEDNADFYFKIKLRKEFSKTKGRNVSCRICKDALKPYYEKRKKEVSDLEEPLYPVGYGGVRKLLQRSKTKAGIKKRVSPHVIRHSSATYFAGILKTSYQLKYRFGWSMGDSTMAQRYIDEDELNDEETSTIIKNTTISDLKEENEKIKIQMELQQQQMAQLLSKMSTMEGLKKAEKIKKGE